jgi:hypothetical protein
LVHAVQQLHSLVTLQRYCAVGPVRTCRSPVRPRASSVPRERSARRVLWMRSA